MAEHDTSDGDKPVYHPPLLSTEQVVEGRGVIDLTKKKWVY